MKKRKYGDILLDLEKLYDEAIDNHEVQWADLIGHCYVHLMVHRPDAKEKYVDGDEIVFYYGSREGLKKV